MFHRILGPRHVLLQAKSSEHLASFAGHRFADMEARKRFLFDHDWLDSFPEKKHCCRGTARSTANYKHIGFDLHRAHRDFESPVEKSDYSRVRRNPTSG